MKKLRDDVAQVKVIVSFCADSMKLSDFCLLLWQHLHWTGGQINPNPMILNDSHFRSAAALHTRTCNKSLPWNTERLMFGYE